MLRENNTVKTGEALADMSQYSIESGRNSIQKQWDNLRKERQILSDRKLTLEQILCQNKLKHPSGLMIAGEHISRIEILKELTGIQKRLVEIKPTLSKLNEELHRPMDEILEEILSLLKRIANR